jgi:hypothetical protein
MNDKPRFFEVFEADLIGGKDKEPEDRTCSHSWRILKQRYIEHSHVGRIFKASGGERRPMCFKEKGRSQRTEHVMF